MHKMALSIVSVGLIVGLGIIFLGGPNNGASSEQYEQDVEVRDGVQYVTINAQGGYFPRSTSAKGGIPTKLIVKTNGTYDCSAALVVRAVGYEEILPPTGEEIIDIGTHEAGTSLRGTCSMGMYNFVINFE